MVRLAKCTIAQAKRPAFARARRMASLETEGPPPLRGHVLMRSSRSFQGRLRTLPSEIGRVQPNFEFEAEEETDLREPYRIPRDLLQDTGVPEPKEALSPLLVFINSRSGGQIGPQLTRVLRQALGAQQVFDLSKHNPERSLKTFYVNVAQAIANNSNESAKVNQRLRIVAAGGDGTVAWLLKTIHDLDVPITPPVAVMPLGTGNDLARTLRWGKTFQEHTIRDRKGVFELLKRVGRANVDFMDMWKVSLGLELKNGSRTEGADLQTDLPHCLQQDGADAYTGYFWNYVSVGVDALAAHKFHMLRETHPKCTPSRNVNQTWYALYGLKAMISARPVNEYLDLFVKDSEGQWSKVELKDNVKGIVLLNLQSYAGGRDLWGKVSNTDKKFKTPSYADGKLEVAGFLGGMHMTAVMGQIGSFHNKRIVQSSAVRLRLKQGERVKKGYLQIDGEPWEQPLPHEEEGELVLEVGLAGQSVVLKAQEEDEPQFGICCPR